MESEDDMGDDCMDWNDEDHEMLEHEKTTLECLRSRKLTVKNGDGTLRCPLSPSRKKQSYTHKDLLQHATAVAKGNREPERAGGHSALMKFLEVDLAAMAAAPVERVLKGPEGLRRNEDADMLVCPWSVVIYNIDNSRKDAEKGIQIGLGKTELKKYFADFKPQKMHVFWGLQGHLGICVLHFGEDLSGLKDAQALEKYFLDREHGRRDYERNAASRSLGYDFYGWMAGEEELNGRSGGYQGAEMSRYLKTHGQLMDIAMVGEEMKRIYSQQVRHLTETVQKSKDEKRFLLNEMEGIRRSAEAKNRKRDETHKHEMDALRAKAQKSETDFNKALEEKDAVLSKLAKEFERNNSIPAENNRSETEMMKDRQKRETIAEQQGLVKKTQVGTVMLVKKHEEEKKRLAERQHNEAIQLANKQNMEMQMHQVSAMLATEIVMGKLSIRDNAEDESQITEQTENQRKIAKLEEELAEMEEENNVSNNTINEMVKKERAATQELNDAKATALRILLFLKQKSINLSTQPPAIEVKRVGEIDGTPWPSAWRSKQKSDSWGLMKKSWWENHIRDSKFQPFKIEKTGAGEDDRKQVIDHENEELRTLKCELGDKVYGSVITALTEIEEFNPSGRYPTDMAWVSGTSRRATIGEVVNKLEEVITTLVTEREGLDASKNGRRKIGRR